MIPEYNSVVNPDQISPTFQAVIREFEAYSHAMKRGDANPDVRPLLRATALHAKTFGLGGIPVGQFAPVMAVFWHYVYDFDQKRIVRAVGRLMYWFLRYVVYRNRPMWNDFWMALWMLSCDPRYIGKLYGHLKRSKFGPVRYTGQWMINSVCQQDALFAEHWQDLIDEQGSCFSEPPEPEEMLMGFKPERPS